MMTGPEVDGLFWSNNEPAPMQEDENPYQGGAGAFTAGGFGAGAGAGGTPSVADLIGQLGGGLVAQKLDLSALASLSQGQIGQLAQYMQQQNQWEPSYGAGSGLGPGGHGNGFQDRPPPTGPAGDRERRWPPDGPAGWQGGGPGGEGFGRGGRGRGRGRGGARSESHRANRAKIPCSFFAQGRLVAFVLVHRSIFGTDSCVYRLLQMSIW